MAVIAQGGSQSVIVQSNNSANQNAASSLVLNQHGMTQAQFSQYQQEVGAKPEGQRESPELWMWEKHYKPDLPQQNQYVYDSGPFQSNDIQSQEAQRQANIASSVRNDIDPTKTSGFKFQQELNDENSALFNKAKNNNPSLTEYQWRSQNIGTDNGGSKLNLSVVPGSYSAPQVVGNNLSSSGNSGNKSAIANKAVASKVAANANKTTSQILSDNAKIAETKKATIVPTATPKPATPVVNKTAQKVAAATSANSKPAVPTTIQKEITAVAKTPAGTGTQTKSTAELLKINSKTKETQKAVIVPAVSKIANDASASILIYIHRLIY